MSAVGQFIWLQSVGHIGNHRWLSSWEASGKELDIGWQRQDCSVNKIGWLTDDRDKERDRREILISHLHVIARTTGSLTVGCWEEILIEFFYFKIKVGIFYWSILTFIQCQIRVGSCDTDFSLHILLLKDWKQVISLESYLIWNTKWNTDDKLNHHTYQCLFCVRLHVLGSVHSTKCLNVAVCLKIEINSSFFTLKRCKINFLCHNELYYHNCMDSDPTVGLSVVLIYIILSGPA